MKNIALKQLKLLGTRISSTSSQEVLDFVYSSLKNKKKFFITTPNPEIILMAQKDAKLRRAINASDVALPDGVGVVWAINFLYGKSVNRIPGRVMFEDLLEFCNRQRLKVFLLGAGEKANKNSILKIKKEYPNIQVAGRYDIYLNREAYSDADRDIIKHIDIDRHINKFKPHILFVALGAPKQEKWIYNNIGNLDVGGAMAVGGTLDSFSGQVAKPPSWISRLGLEWIWRGVLEPARFRRIFNAVVVFPVNVMVSRYKKY